MRTLLPLLLVACSDGEPFEPPPPLPIVSCQASSGLYPSADRVRVEVPDCGAIELDTLRIVGEGNLRFELFSDGTQLLPQIVADGDGTFEALHFSGTWWTAGEANAAFWRQGYASGSPSGVFPLAGVLLDDRGLPVVGAEPDAETPFSSWWAGLAGRPEGGAVIVGTVAARTTKSFVAIGPEEIHIVWGGAGERIELAAGEAIYLDPLFLGIGGDAVGLWQAWADLAARTVQLPPVGEPPGVVWASGPEHDEDALRANLEVAASLGPELRPIEVVRIDGDAATTELAAEIEAAGLRPGIRLTPFLVDRASAVYEAHADWWVRGRDGEELDVDGHAALDATHPDAGAWMAEQVAARVAEGYTHLELDGLAAGAVEGVRSEAVTGAEAYAVGLALLQGAAGDARIVASDAPLLPTLGFADGWRSADPVVSESRAASVRDAAARAFLDGRWWWNLPAPLRLEAVSDEEARGAVVASVVTGSGTSLGDDLVTLSAERLALALDPDLPIEAGTPRRPLATVSSFDSPQRDEAAAVPARWELADGTVGLLNMGESSLDVQGPGGVELLTGLSAEEGPRTLLPGEGELWR